MNKIVKTTEGDAHFTMKEEFEDEDQAIARFNAKKGNTGVAGGKATSYDTIYADEQLSSAEDRVIDKTTTSKTTNSAIGTDAKGNPILVEPKVKTADDII